MATVTTDNSYYSAIADAIRAKNGGTTTYKPSEMADAITNIDTMSEDAILALCQNQITDFASEELINMKSPVFYRNIGLTSVTLPNTTTLCSNAFSDCTNLISADLPKVKVLPTYCFYKCSSLTTVNLPEVVEMTHGNSGYTFYYCESLISVYLPKCTTLAPFCFQYCTALETVDLPVVTDISNYFRYDTALTALILRKTDEIVSVSSKGLADSGIANGTGYVYVPSALVDTYKADSNWGTYADQIRAIEDYPEICG